MRKRSMCRFTSVLLIISVVFSLASCKKVEAEYVLRFTTSDEDCYYYSLNGDTIETLSSFQYNNAIEFGDDYSSSNYEICTIDIYAGGDDPAGWEYTDEDNLPLDDEQKQLWIERMRAMDLPFTGTISVLFYTIDDYMIVYAWKFEAREAKNIEVRAVFHNDKNIGTITEDKGLLNRVYKHNQ